MESLASAVAQRCPSPNSMAGHPLASASFVASKRARPPATATTCGATRRLPAKASDLGPVAALRKKRHLAHERALEVLRVRVLLLEDGEVLVVHVEKHERREGPDDESDGREHGGAEDLGGEDVPRIVVRRLVDRAGHLLVDPHEDLERAGHEEQRQAEQHLLHRRVPPERDVGVQVEGRRDLEARRPRGHQAVREVDLRDAGVRGEDAEEENEVRQGEAGELHDAVEGAQVPILRHGEA
mmetsp:Transcript_20953/g.48517  ORF Transcript_20953/g.48517 Transcript_20953/m.48517 type:complete len:240 (-) Transcript_20953:249-968(-)